MGVGMPQTLRLEMFGRMIYEAFGEVPYHVGSSLREKQWRDVDVRLLLPDDRYAALGFGDPEFPHRSALWVTLCLALSDLGSNLTGLPIDFQIQQQSYANRVFGKPGHSRGALGVQLGGNWVDTLSGEESA